MKTSPFLTICAFCAPRRRVASLATPKPATRAKRLPRGQAEPTKASDLDTYNDIDIAIDSDNENINDNDNVNDENDDTDDNDNDNDKNVEYLKQSKCGKQKIIHSVLTLVVFYLTSRWSVCSVKGHTTSENRRKSPHSSQSTLPVTP